MTLRDALARIPVLRGRDTVPTIEVLPAGANRVYRIGVEGESFVLKLPGPGSLGDPETMLVNSGLAARTGLGPEVLWSEPTGVMLMRDVPGGRRLDAQGLGDPEMLARVVERLRDLHRLPVTFAGTLDPAGELERYLAITRSAGRGCTREILETVERAARRTPPPPPARPVPCHVDPCPQNFLWDGHRLWLIDWEYAGMGDPWWDLAYLAAEGHLDARARSRLLAIYFGVAGAEERGALRERLRWVELVNTAWTLAQVTRGARELAPDLARRARSLADRR